MEAASGDAGFGTVFLALVCIAIGFYASRIVKNMHAVSEGVAHLRAWRWVQRPIIFAPPPQLHQAQQTILRSDEYEVALTSSMKQGVRLALLQVRFSNRTLFEFQLFDHFVAGVRYYPPGDRKNVATLGMLMRWSHPAEYAAVEKFCATCLEEVAHWESGSQH